MDNQNIVELVEKVSGVLGRNVFNENYFNTINELCDLITEQNKKIDRHERALKLIIKNTVSGHVETIAKKSLDGKF